MSDAPIKTLWDNDRAMREIESLRDQLSDHIKREVMLRDTIDKAATQIKRCDYTPARSVLLQALAATADLSKYVLCEGEPFGIWHEGDTEE